MEEQEGNKGLLVFKHWSTSRTSAGLGLVSACCNCKGANARIALMSMIRRTCFMTLLALAAAGSMLAELHSATAKLLSGFGIPHLCMLGPSKCALLWM